jgi:hypothetical protein
VKTGEQNFLLPLFSARPGKKKGYSAVQNGTVLSSFFLTVYETTPF